MLENMINLIPQVFSYNTLKAILVFISIVLISYFVGKLVALILKIILKNILGLDKWLHDKQIMTTYSFTDLIVNITKFFIYFYFLGLSFYVISYFSNIGILIFEILNNLLIIIIVMIISYAMSEFMLRSFLYPAIQNFKYVNFILGSIRFIVLFFILVLTLSYLNILSPVLLYMFIILFGGIVISISIAIGIALGDILKEKFREIIK
ncbi:MAG: hypothetical protein RQ869_03125 [Candidatus Nanopusillus sp.]|jgi:hypothetical protein|nr:hypothetical protein [Candidatus Nanopusillus sp.]